MNNIEVNAVDIKLHQHKKSRATGTGHKNLAACRQARAEVLREFYSNLEWKSNLEPDDPKNKSKNSYFCSLEPTENISPFDDLDKLEEIMPKKENYSKFLY